MNFIFVYATFPTEDEAEKVGMHLLEKKMIACFVFHSVKNACWWKGKIEKRDEIVLIGKTTEDKFEEIKKEIEKLHSYEIPYIVKIRLDEVNEKFGEWFTNTKGGTIG